MLQTRQHGGRKFIAQGNGRATVIDSERQGLGAKQHRQRHGHSTQLQHGHVSHRRLKSLWHDNGHSIALEDPPFLKFFAESIGRLMKVAKRPGLAGLRTL